MLADVSQSEILYDHEKDDVNYEKIGMERSPQCIFE